MLLWDGGNNDLPFYRPDVHVVVADPLRAGHEPTLPPRRGQPPHGRRDRRQQGGHRRVEQVIAAAWRRIAASRTRRRPSSGRTAASRSTTATRSAGKRVLVRRGRPDAHARRDEVRRAASSRRAARRRRDRRPAALGGRHDRGDLPQVRRRPGAAGDGVLGRPARRDGARSSTRPRSTLVVIGTPIDLRRVIEIIEAGRARSATTSRCCPTRRRSLTSWRRCSRAEPVNHTGVGAMERVVIALGGNALLRRGARTTRSRRPVRVGACRRPSGSRTSPPPAGRSWSPHGNGPPGGPDPAAAGGCRRRSGAPDAARRLRRRRARAASATSCRSRSATSSSSAGWSGRSRLVLTLDARRPQTTRRSRSPTKPIGPFYEEAGGEAVGTEHGHGCSGPDPHGGFRRVVPSPDPYSIVEAPRDPHADRPRATIVIASGGGGIPVVEEGPRLDRARRAWSTRTSQRRSWPATSRRIDALLVLTDVPGRAARVRYRARAEADRTG